MRHLRALRIAAAAAGIALMATGCGATGKSSTGSESSAAGPITGLQIMVPNTPGGGYDTTARVAAKVLDD